MQQAPKVSVAMIAFNQERFIEQAIRSALMQKTSFEFEIVVGEDASTDRTRDAIVELAGIHPDRIRPVLHDTNVGMHRNLIDVLAHCRGTYVALLEGDDYWTDPEKLQRQACLLDRSPDVAVCHHNATALYDDGRGPPFIWHARRPRRLTTVDSLLDGNAIVTCTAMFRNGLLGEWPAWFTATRAADWPLHVLNARHGKIAYIDRVMAVYRIHAGGVWSSLPQRRTIEGMIATADLMKQALTARQWKRLSKTITRWHADLVELMLAEGRIDEAMGHGLRHLSRASRLRLAHFYQGLELEREGRRWPAFRHFFRAAVAASPKTRVKLSDVALALTRVAFPRLYRASRTIWRRGRAVPRSPAGSPDAAR
ncbi:MAG TPA: glycosyltransferase [Pirellulales bacterium]|nr:glycosyltransferase [Pirellulales bacterium]